MRNVKVVVEYDGTDFSGFQYQTNGRTIQGELERTLAKIVKEKVIVYGSGRTDAGVHASGQVINFRTRGTIPVENLCIAMNTLLPTSIAAVEAEEADDTFHARYSAKSRHYQYVILNRMLRGALQSRFTWYMQKELDLSSMKKAAELLIGVHDFSSFACVDRYDGSSIRDVQDISIELIGDLIIIEVAANAFLRSMVRVIAGTLVEVGLGKRRSSEMLDILAAKDRRSAGKTAPACGLCLTEVEY